MGLFKVNTNIPNKPIKNPNWQEADQLLFTTATKELNSGRPRTNAVDIYFKTNFTNYYYRLVVGRVWRGSGLGSSVVSGACRRNGRNVQCADFRSWKRWDLNVTFSSISHRTFLEIILILCGVLIQHAMDKITYLIANALMLCRWNLRDS